MGTGASAVEAVQGASDDQLKETLAQLDHADRDKIMAALSQGAPLSKEEVDVLIIGAGFSGCWFADHFKTQQPTLKVLLVEASKRIGGRLRSDHNDEEQGEKCVVQDELGGMRIFPNKMPKIMEIVKRFGFDMMPLGLEDATNLFNRNGVTVRKQDALMPDGGEWAGKKITEMSAKAVEAYKATEFWEQCKNHAYNCPELRSLSLPEFFVKYAKASPAEIRCWFDYSGYNLHHEDAQSSIYVHDGELYGSEMSHHHFVKQGYMECVIQLHKASGVETRKETTVSSLRKDGEKIVATLAGGCEISASKVVIGVTAKQILRIEGLGDIISEKRLAAVKSCKAIPLFKCFMDFSTPWWTKHGFTQGKSTSDTDARQIHYYDEQDLLIYVSDGDGGVDGEDYASRWGREFQEDKPKALRRMFDIVKKIHMDGGVPEEEIIEPNWDQCVHAYWESGSHKWKKDADVYDCIKEVSDGSADGSQVYIVGDAFCDMQGWVEGAINTVEMAYAKAFP